MKLSAPPPWLWLLIALVWLMIMFVHPGYGQRSPDDWFELATAIQKDVEQADSEGWKLPKLDAEDRRFIRKMVNELSVNADAKPTAAQGQWLLAIRVWIDEALERPLYPR